MGSRGVMDLGLFWDEASESQELSRCCGWPCKRGWGCVRKLRIGNGGD